MVLVVAVLALAFFFVERILVAGVGVIDPLPSPPPLYIAAVAVWFDSALHFGGVYPRAEAWCGLHPETIPPRRTAFLGN